MAHNDIIKKTEDFVTNLFAEKLSPALIYHNLSHTANVAESAKKIGKKCELSSEDLEIVTIAAWFHDTGYTESYNNHEEAGKLIASAFLDANNYDPDKKEKVLSCIDATKMPQSPKSAAEQVLCDADLSHLGKEDFFNYKKTFYNIFKQVLEGLTVKDTLGKKI